MFSIKRYITCINDAILKFCLRRNVLKVKIHDSLRPKFLFSMMYMSYIRYNGLSRKVTLRSRDRVVFGCGLPYMVSSGIRSYPIWSYVKSMRRVKGVSGFEPVTVGWLVSPANRLEFFFWTSFLFGIFTISKGLVNQKKTKQP